MYGRHGGENCGYTSFDLCWATIGAEGGWWRPKPFSSGSWIVLLIWPSFGRNDIGTVYFRPSPPLRGLMTTTANVPDADFSDAICRYPDRGLQRRQASRHPPRTDTACLHLDKIAPKVCGAWRRGASSHPHQYGYRLAGTRRTRHALG